MGKGLGRRSRAPVDSVEMPELGFGEARRARRHEADVARFYATGWDISPHATGCPGENDPHPIFGFTYRRSKDNGDVWGHFVNVVEFSSWGKADDLFCNFDELGNCIAVLIE